MADVAEDPASEPGLVAEAVAEDAEGPRGVAEAFGGLGGGETFDEIGAEGLVLAVERLLGGEEEPGLRC